MVLADYEETEVLVGLSPGGGGGGGGGGASTAHEQGGADAAAPKAFNSATAATTTAGEWGGRGWGSVGGGVTSAMVFRATTHFC
jgi:hypothetical protein